MPKTHFYRRRISVDQNNQAITLPTGLTLLHVKNIGNNKVYFDFDNAVDTDHSPEVNAGNSWGDGSFKLPDNNSGVFSISSINVKCDTGLTSVLQIVGFTLEKQDAVV